MTEADYVVLRPAPGISSASIGDYWFGRWLDLAHVPVVDGRRVAAMGIAQWTARPSGRFEYRDDGACAEVWEMGPDA